MTLARSSELVHVLSAAQWEASRQRQSKMAAAHLLLGFFHPPLTEAGRALLALGVQPRRDRLSTLETGEEVWPPAIPLLPQVMPLADDAERVLQFAEQEAASRGDATLTPAHLLIGLLAAGCGDTYLLLRMHDITITKARQALFSSQGT